MDCSPLWWEWYYSPIPDSFLHEHQRSDRESHYYTQSRQIPEQQITNYVAVMRFCPIMPRITTPSAIPNPIICTKCGGQRFALSRCS
jgi:hypothetical protein